MAGTVLTYSPSDVKLVVSGSLTGVLGIRLTWNAAPMQIRRGIRGQHTRVFNRDLSAQIAVEVMQTSVTNDVLFQILAQDRVLGGARIDLALSDNSGRSLLQTAEAYVMAFPEVAFSSGFNARTWTFELLNVTDGSLTGASGQETDFFSSIPGAGLLSNIAGVATDLFT